MGVRNALMGGSDWTNGEVLYGVSDLNDTVNRLVYNTAPLKAVFGYLKTFSQVSSGTADTDTVDKLVDSSATFVTDGVAVGDVIHNTTDDTFAIVSAVDSETSLSLAADTQGGSSTTDVFPDGNEAYVIYDGGELPDNYVELNGQTLSDAESPFNGDTLPDLNGGTYRMLRGDISSGTTGGADTHTLTTAEMPVHSHNISGVTTTANSGSGKVKITNSGSASSATTDNAGSGNAHNNLPAYYAVVWIMKVKY